MLGIFLTLELKERDTGSKNSLGGMVGAAGATDHLGPLLPADLFLQPQLMCPEIAEPHTYLGFLPTVALYL